MKKNLTINCQVRSWLVRTGSKQGLIFKTKTGFVFSKFNFSFGCVCSFLPSSLLGCVLCSFLQWSSFHLCTKKEETWTFFKLKKLGERTEAHTRFLRQFWFIFQKGGVMKPCQTFKKRKAPKKGWDKRNKGQGPKSRQANSPKEAGHKGGKGNTKNQTLHQCSEDVYN